MRSVRKDIVISFLDQALLSAANFAIGVFLIKNTSKEDYGVYVFAYAIILFIIGVQNALITNQMTVMAPRKQGQERDHFCAALMIGQYLLAIPLGMLSVLFIFLFANSRFASGLNNNMLLAVVVATQGVLLREFFRVFFFLKIKSSTVLQVDILHIVVMFLGLFAGRAYFPESLNVVAVLSFGLSSLVSGVLAAHLSEIAIKVRLAEVVVTLRETWVNGKWALGGVVVTWLDNQSYIYLLTLLSGPATTAEVNAARLFLMPVGLLNASVFRVLLPKWAHYRAENQVGHISSSANKALVLIVGSISVYLIVLLAIKDEAIRLFLTKDYSNLNALIVLWGLLFIAQAVKSNFSTLLQVFERYRAITLLNMASATVVIAASAILITRIGAEGSIIGMIAGEVILSMLLFNKLKRTMSTSHYEGSFLKK